jgi:predicted acyl esterase
MLVRGRTAPRLVRVVVVLCATTTAWSVGPIDAAVRTAHRPLVAPARATPSVVGGTEQVSVIGAPSGIRVRLRAVGGTRVDVGVTDSGGSHLFRRVEPGGPYVVRIGSRRFGPVDVAARTDPPPLDLYRGQALAPGFGYLRTRDGTSLSVNVHLPGPADAGPYPTVVEYSGYDVSDPASTQPVSRVAQLLGYATVGVNLRGTGCSGGAFDYFEVNQLLDGFDVIEAVAAQPWVLHGRVGMVGISYSGVTQLFVAAMRPPHLAAITPLSVFGDVYSVAYPGGIFNRGFARQWARDRVADARPAARPWAARRIADGDRICAANQALRRQSIDLVAAMRRQRYYEPGRLDALAPRTFVHSVEAPVFLAGTWQDEQTGAGWAELIDRFDPSVPARFTMINGLHADSLAPVVAAAWAEFLDLYVARRVPEIPASARAVAPFLFQQVYGVAGITLPPDRFAPDASFAEVLRAYESEPRHRILFESGAGRPEGAPVPTFELASSSWPWPTSRPQVLYLGSGGRLRSEPPVRPRGADRFRHDPDAFARTNVAHDPSASGAPGASPRYLWRNPRRGTALSYVTAVLETDTVVVGGGSVDLWLGATERDVDIEVTIGEIGPDGDETYVQSGRLRASARTLDRRESTVVHPVPTYRRRDARPLPDGRLVLVRVPLDPVAHVFRAGSRIRLVVQPPGGNLPRWEFRTRHYDDDVVVTIGRHAAAPSRLVLPVDTAASVPQHRPTCGVLRGQPCRDGG